MALHGMNKRAVTSWNAYDINTIRPSWSLARCDREMVKVEKYVRDRIIELGWEVWAVLLTDEKEKEKK